MKTAPPSARIAGTKPVDSERKAELSSDARQAVAEAVTDANPRIVENPELGRRGGANVDPELELIGDLEWTFTG